MTCLGVSAILALSGATFAFAAPPADWSAIPTTVVKLFYPGQSTFDWLRSPEHKRVFKKVASFADRGMVCAVQQSENGKQDDSVEMGRRCR